MARLVRAAYKPIRGADTRYLWLITCPTIDKSIASACLVMPLRTKLYESVGAWPAWSRSVRSAQEVSRCLNTAELKVIIEGLQVLAFLVRLPCRIAHIPPHLK